MEREYTEEQKKGIARCKGCKHFEGIQEMDQMFAIGTFIKCKISPNALIQPIGGFNCKNYGGIKKDS